jgi:hypothetical protein
MFVECLWSGNTHRARLTTSLHSKNWCMPNRKDTMKRFDPAYAARFLCDEDVKEY